MSAALEGWPYQNCSCEVSDSFVTGGEGFYMSQSVCVCVCVFNIFFKNVFLHILMRVKISNSDFFSCCLF